ncbi:MULTISPECIES: DNA polymerase III subunit beta [Psychroflexus]|uniref:Beta sliding clamp n=1 Tax=Psychroflexus halocasei TaxID=908615 RepID=A0A1H4B1X5_9FLAO|nr:MULTISPECIES: DNA polymerase III subunit beta [Psychroflexus]PJX23235.1 DNA polymerase III subunit beta [Psychroflexus sp. S27]SEA42195.1 DNA polymerase-3 subunit beta [Psychroflexus halocasei]
MKFIVSSSHMLKKLQLLGGVLNNNNTLPILDNFLFEISSGKLSMTASDLETTITSTLEIETTDEGSIAVPAKLILDTLKTFPEQPLTFVVNENNTLEISSDQGKYEIAYADAEDYPNEIEVEDAMTTDIQGDILATAIHKTLFATGNDDLRPVMNGVLFQMNEQGTTFVGTDAHKLVKYHRADKVVEKATEFIMPKKPLTILRNTLQGEENDVKIEYNESNAKFIFEDIQLTCRLVDGKYPNYEAVIPQENPNVLVVDKSQFLNSVKRVSIFSNKTTHQIRLKIAGSELHISAEDVDYSNRAKERLTCDYQGDDIEIGFNSKFLIEMLGNLTADQVQLRMSLPNRAGILTPVDGLEEGETITMLVMPVMLSNS